MQCSNNLKQHGLALHNAHDTYKEFPPILINGWTNQNPSAATAVYKGGYMNLRSDGEKITYFFCLLPYMEQQTLVADLAWDNCVLGPSKTRPNEWWDANPLPILTCPSDQASTKTVIVGGYSWIFGGANQPASLTSYVPSAKAFGKYVPGTKDQSIWNLTWDNCSGEKNIASFKDGTSNTIAEVEKPMITGDNIVTAIGWGVQGSSGLQDGANVWGKTDISAEVVPAFGCNCNDPTQSWDDEEGQWWNANCRFTVNGITQEFFQPPSKLRPPDQQRFWNVYPNHAGGLVQTLMADGSVQSVNNNIDLFVWSALVTPAGNDRSQ